jgi:hypothetical protein
MKNDMKSAKQNLIELKYLVSNGNLFVTTMYCATSCDSFYKPTAKHISYKITLFLYSVTYVN